MSTSGNPNDKTLTHGVDPEETMVQQVLDSEADFTRESGANAADAAFLDKAEAEDRKFPIENWERYQILKWLGSGGMGRVFLARDPRLQRLVAIKVVSGRSPELARLLISEARLQAGVKHDCICKVHEVGEQYGTVFIVMEYIQGQTLHFVAEKLSTREKLQIVVRVCDALQVAHDTGMIHRDIKPGNIMVEVEPDGQLKPYVMDFGLAQFAEEGAVCEAQTAGTPGFMAPEQRADSQVPVDHRADIYGIGALLCKVLLGVYPEPLDEGAPAWHGALAPDLEAILVRCLNRIPGQRYASAQELGEDLQRYLDGDPVRAHHGGPVYWSAKKLRKHRRLASVAALVFLVLLFLGAANLRERYLGAERERLARDYTARIERIEALARQTVMAPLHDTRNSQNRLLELTQAMEAHMVENDALKQGQWHEALGRAYFTLGNWEKAASHLESGIAKGYDSPRTAYLRGMILGDTYRRELQLADLIASEEKRKDRLDALRETYQQPVLDLLNRAEDPSLPAADFRVALIAFFEKDYVKTLDLLDQLVPEPWFFEHHRLRGDVFQTYFKQAWSSGDRETALTQFTNAEAAYQQAINIARSEAKVHLDLANLNLSMMVFEVQSKGDVNPYFQAGMAHLDRALEANPEHGESLTAGARFYRRLAEQKQALGEKAEEELEQAKALANRAAMHLENSGDAFEELGMIQMAMARMALTRGGDAETHLVDAKASFAKLDASYRDYSYYNNLGLIYWSLVKDRNKRGRDATAPRDQAIEGFRQALKLDPSRADAQVNLGLVLLDRAARTEAPIIDLEQAKQAFEKAKALNPQMVAAHYYMGQVHRRLADHHFAEKGRHLNHLEMAAAAFEDGAVLNPKLPHFPAEKGAVLRSLANLAWEQGHDADVSRRLAIDTYEKAKTLAPKQTFIYNNLGEVFLDGARQRIWSGENGKAWLEQAASNYASAHELTPDHPMPLANLSQAHLLRAEAMLYNGQNPQREIQKAESYIQKALAINPEHPEAGVGAAHAHLLRALASIDTQAFQQHLDAAGEKIAKLKGVSHDLAAWVRAEYFLWRAAAAKRDGLSNTDMLDQGRAALENLSDKRKTASHIRLLAFEYQTLQATPDALPLSSDSLNPKLSYLKNKRSLLFRLLSEVK